MFEKELAKIDGMKTLLTQQKFMIESKLTISLIKQTNFYPRQFIRQGCIPEFGCRIQGGRADEQELER